MASFNSPANSENKQSIAPVLQKFWSKQSELSEQKPATDGVKQQAKKYVRVTKNDQPTNECSVKFPKNNEEDKPVQSGKIQLPEKFQQNQKSVTEVTKSSSCEKKPIKYINQTSKQETETRPMGAGPKTTDVEQANNLKSAPVQDQCSKLPLHKLNGNSSTQEQESTDLNVFQQKSNGKKFRKLTMKFDNSSLPKPPKKIDIDLSTIRLQYQKAVSNHKEDPQEDDVYVIDVEAMIAEEQRESTNKTCYRDITSILSAKAEAEDIYDDGFTPSPVCEPDDSLYLEAVTVTMRKSLTNQKVAIEEDDDNIYDIADA